MIRRILFFPSSSWLSRSNEERREENRREGREEEEGRRLSFSHTGTSGCWNQANHKTEKKHKNIPYPRPSHWGLFPAPRRRSGYDAPSRRSRSRSSAPPAPGHLGQEQRSVGSPQSQVCQETRSGHNKTFSRSKPNKLTKKYAALFSNQ